MELIELSLLLAAKRHTQKSDIVFSGVELMGEKIDTRIALPIIDRLVTGGLLRRDGYGYFITQRGDLALESALPVLKKLSQEIRRAN